MEQFILFFIVLAILIASFVTAIKLFRYKRWMIWIPSFVMLAVTAGLFITALSLDSWAALGYIIFTMIAFVAWLVLVLFNTIYLLKHKKNPTQKVEKDTEDLSKHL